MKIYIASDHNGIEKVKFLQNALKEYDVEKINLENSEDDDYPDFAFNLCKKVLNNNDSLGILLCGNGVGMAIAANKVKGIRCGKVSNVDEAYAAKIHNEANVIALGSKIDNFTLLSIVKKFITTSSENVLRHKRRVEKIIKYENGEYNV